MVSFDKILWLRGPIMDFNEILWESRKADKSAVAAINRALRRLRRLAWITVLNLLISIIGSYGDFTAVYNVAGISGKSSALRLCQVGELRQEGEQGEFFVCCNSTLQG
jgi:hypothetical protein